MVEGLQDPAPHLPSVTRRDEDLPEVPPADIVVFVAGEVPAGGIDAVPFEPAVLVDDADQARDRICDRDEQVDLSLELLEPPSGVGRAHLARMPLRIGRA